MALFKGLFGKKEPNRQESKPAPMPIDVTAGLSYMEVRERVDSQEKWMLMKAFAEKGDEIEPFAGVGFLDDESMVFRCYGVFHFAVFIADHFCCLLICR